MTNKLISSFTLLFSSGLLLAACASTPGADIILSLPEDVQRHAHMQCQAGEGLSVSPPFQVQKFRDGRSLVSANNGPGVSLSQARSINKCAREKMLAGPIEISQEQTLLEEKQVFFPTPTKQPFHGAFGCVSGGGVMQGGASICPGR